MRRSVTATVLSLMMLTALVGLAVPASAQDAPVQVTLTLLRDSWTDTANPFTNFGSDVTLKFGQNGIGPFYHTLIEWDVSVIPVTATILDANLTVQTVDTGTATFESEVRTILESWGESTVNQSNEPSLSTTVFDRFDNDVETSGLRSKNITNAVQALIGTTTFGLAFLNDSTPNKFQEWRSSEHGIGPAPVLVVTYTTPTAAELAFSQIVSLFPLVLLLSVLGIIVLGVSVRYGQGTEWGKWLTILFVVVLVVATLILVSFMLALT